jgi:hypothetical protein
MKSVFAIMCTILGFFFLAGCQQPDGSSQEAQNKTVENTAAAGFNANLSDAQAITIADSVMKAMGGRKNWNKTEIISWNFFGDRTHTWNRQTGRDSINIPAQNLVIDMNVQSKKGVVMKNGDELSRPDSVQKYLQQGYQMWVNDSYWLLMPYKLKDSGVTLDYMGIDSTQSGMPAYKLKLTFDNIGLTPDNMYYVYVDTADYLVRQWAYYPEAEMEEPQFVLPWNDYREYGGIMLSGNRGKFALSEIKVMDEWPQQP